jgi:2-desacetyl-2-hydroxyethyl bacteriochlorophyllide A dehydrogenase
MKVVHINEPGQIKIIEKPMPIPKKGEALLKIKYCGICGADVATFTGNQPFASYPRIPGHEFSAEIVEIEENDLGLEKGMIVTANPYFNCGECYSCRRGKVNCCESNETMGVQRDGSFAEYVAMPIERIYKGRGLTAKQLALIEPFSISYHALSRGNVKKGDKVLVFGAGPIGILAMISAKFKGAQVYVVDILKERLEKAMAMGADGIINVTKEDLVEYVAEKTNKQGMDVCVEATGRPETFMNAIDSLAFGGEIILIGNGKKETTFNHSVLLKKEVNLYGSRNSLKKDFDQLIELMSENKVNIDEIITHVYDLDKALDAFEALVHNDGTKLKVLVKFD